MIYAVQILGNKFVKIGFSSSDNVEDRLSALQTGCPFRISVVGTIPGTLRQEQTLHGALLSAFGRVRIPMPPNEWYPGRNPFFVKFLEELSFGFGQGHAYLEGYNPAIKQPGSRLGKGTFEPVLRWPTLSAKAL